MKSFFVAFFFLLMISFCPIQAQNQEDSLMKSYMLELRQSIDHKEYKASNEILKKIFGLKKTMPDEVAYFYGLTMFHFNNYKSANEAFVKYLKLTKDKGEFYNYAQMLQKEAQCRETGYYILEETCEECEGGGKIEIQCRNCKGSGKEFCSQCGGKGVYKYKEDFGEKYATCNKCSGSGFLRCSKCDATKKELSDCAICNGSGIVKFKKGCED